MTQKRFTTYAWIVLAYLLAIILWGAYVRATGSGAGCGSHWPLCNGEIIPRSPQTETLVEFTHRLTSGFSGVLVLIMLVWAFRTYPSGHLVRRGAVLSTVFIIIEGLIGAGLVRFELVATNDSVARAITIVLHLVNTFILLAAVTLTAWWSRHERPLQLRDQGLVGWLLGIGFVGMLVLGASGAVTALGDTLFPAASLAEGLRQDFSSTAHFLLRLRFWHPVISIGMGLYLIGAGTMIYMRRPSANTRRFSRALKIIFLVQLGVGALNVYLLAPVWMQLIHLFLADTVWIVLVLLAASALAQEAPQSESVRLATQSGD